MSTNNQSATFADAIENINQSQMATVDNSRLRGGQAHLLQIKKRIEKELEQLRREEPPTRQEITRRAYEAAQARHTDIARAYRQARRKMEAHQEKFSRDMPLESVPAWVRDNSQMGDEVTAFADLLRMSDTYVEFCRLQAADALRQPDENRVRILQRVATLKDEFKSLNWNAAQTKRGEEILYELQELQKMLGPVVEEWMKEA